MKKSIIAIIVIVASLLLTFIIGNAFGYWYECGKPICEWASATRENIMGFTLTLGLLGGSIIVFVINSKH